MNTSMFLPQVAEDDVYDKNGQKEDDVNSVVEYIRVALGFDKTADDEDDNSGQNLHLVKNTEYCYQQHIVILRTDNPSEIKKQTFSEYKIPLFGSPSLDIPTPPPNSIS